MNQSCEFVLYEERPLRVGGRRVYPVCSRPATYLWTPRRRLAGQLRVCQYHGEGLAGNWTDELKSLP